MQRVVSRRRVKVGSRLQHRKLLLHVLVERENDGYGRHEHITDKRLDQVCEGSGETITVSVEA